VSHGDEGNADIPRGSFQTVLKGITAPAHYGRSTGNSGRYAGDGIGVAVIDSGVSPVQGLSTPGQVVNGPDLSFDSQDPDTRHLDGFGHGTHMAGIIAGRDGDAFVGVAPGARIINVKVAAADGATDISQVIAGIDWVVEHRHDRGLNIRVLNLSFGTTAMQSYQLDPLAYAVEVAWRKGIVVVVSAGNDGSEGTTLTNPAIDPFVIAVGAADNAGTDKRNDDYVASFSSVGNSSRGPDLVAPGRSIVSLRTPGSFIDENHAEGRVSYAGQPRFFRGSGTSQAAAVVSGSVALLLADRPTLTPDQVKWALQRTATRITGPAIAQGAGLIDLDKAGKLNAGSAPRQQFPPATGRGSLELARGGSHVVDPETGAELTGEQDIFGHPWQPASWTAAAWNETAWTGGIWNAVAWTGPDWGGSSWAGETWRSISWANATWLGKTWRADLWSGKTWRNNSWTGTTWRDACWNGKTWRGDDWRSANWA
jgi:serine protease AprX